MSDETELSLDPLGRRVLLLRKWNVQFSSSALGPVQIWRGTSVSTVPGNRIRRIERSMAGLTRSHGYVLSEHVLVRALRDD